MTEQDQNNNNLNEYQVIIQPPARMLRGMDNVGALVKSVQNLGEKVGKLEGSVLRIEMEPILQDLINLGDSIDRAIPHFEEKPCDDSLKRILSFLELTRQEIEGILRRYGVVVIDSIAVPFNPDLHKIKQVVDCDSQESHDLILEVLNVGYRFKELILRPAEVVVMRKQNPVAKED